MGNKLGKLAFKAVELRKEAYKIRMYTKATMGVDLDSLTVVYSPGQTHIVKQSDMELYLETSISMSEMLINSVKTRSFNNQEYQKLKDILLGCVEEISYTPIEVPSDEFPKDETEVEKPFDEGNEEGHPGGLPKDVKPVEKETYVEESEVAPIQEVEMHEGEPLLGRIEIKGEEVMLTKYVMIELLDDCKSKKQRKDFLRAFREAGIDEEIVLEVEALTS